MHAIVLNIFLLLHILAFYNLLQIFLTFIKHLFMVAGDERKPIRKGLWLICRIVSDVSGHSIICLFMIAYNIKSSTMVKTCLRLSMEFPLLKLLLLLL